MILWARTNSQIFWTPLIFLAYNFLDPIFVRLKDLMGITILFTHNLFWTYKFVMGPNDQTQPFSLIVFIKVEHAKICWHITKKQFYIQSGSKWAKQWWNCTPFLCTCIHSNCLSLDELCSVQLDLFCQAQSSPKLDGTELSLIVQFSTPPTHSPTPPLPPKK